MNIITPRRLVKLDDLVSRPQDLDSPRRQSNFASDMARDAFGQLGHRFDDQWADHVGAHPNDIAEKRRLAIWGGAP